jgi:hypothetical protein
MLLFDLAGFMCLIAALLTTAFAVIAAPTMSHFNFFIFGINAGLFFGNAMIKWVEGVFTRK